MKDAIITNIDKVSIITKGSLPHTNPIISDVMKHLDEINSGTIQKKDLKKALLNYDDNNLTSVDVDSIVNNVFKNNTSLSRSEVRKELNLN